LQIISTFKNLQKDKFKNQETLKSTMSTKQMKSTKSTTIRISDSTKEALESLDFVKKHTFDEIILKLIEEHKKGNKK
jgi:hypothetical protein